MVEAKTMSYCRRGHKGSEIYLYGDMGENAIVCLDCLLNDCQDTILKKRTDAIAHLKEHQRVGHLAPFKRVIASLEAEIAEDGDEVDLPDWNTLKKKAKAYDKQLQQTKEKIKKCEYYKEKYREDKQSVDQLDRVIEALKWTLGEGDFPW